MNTNVDYRLPTDLHIFLEREPTDQSERWSNRPFRALSVVHPPANAAQAPVEAASDKMRFLDNLWLAQALYRSKSGRSIPFASGEMDVGSSRRTTIAKTYFNVYQRTAYLSEPSKVCSCICYRLVSYLFLIAVVFCC